MPYPPMPQPGEFYLEQNPPTQTQFRSRRTEVRPVIILHTSESVLDTVGEDTGAENVARFIQRRTNYGSYHAIADSDSIVYLVDPRKAAFGARSHNDAYFHVSFACRTTDWTKMSVDRRRAFADNGAYAAAQIAERMGLDIEAVRLHDATSGSGFTTHANVDPSRRSDPGTMFPWMHFLDRYRAHSSEPPAPLNYDYPGWRLLEGQNNSPAVENLQRLLNEIYDANIDVDGDFGPLTSKAVATAICTAGGTGVVDARVWGLLFGSGT